MKKVTFISIYLAVCKKVISAEKLSPVPYELTQLGWGIDFSIARGYTQLEITYYAYLLYLMGREDPKFKINNQIYTFDEVPLINFKKLPNGRTPVRPDPEWLWHQWQKYM